ncbi:MAG: UDP-N-acetylglucosamine 2-epimerase (non-hydrolyzing), partial [Cytophagales bacterium]|nr:UDP-N-acetylglucosamine 2-epimerase (non-hydrolyzing) [Cytophagales bacterium]
MKKIVTVIGARPQFIKAAPMSRQLAKGGFEEILVHTGQHYDESLSGIFFDQLHLPKPNYQLEVGSLSHGAQTARMLEKIEQVLMSEKPDLLLVYGDTNSTLAGALAASKMHIPVAHVEAGLRSFNTKMPEEINRVLTDHCSSLLFAPTQVAVENLLKEGISDSKITQTGDIMYDASVLFEPMANRSSSFCSSFQLRSNAYILATIHRAENTDQESILRNILGALHYHSQKETVIFPLHPRTKAAFIRFGIDYLSLGIQFIEPLGY